MKSPKIEDKEPLVTGDDLARTPNLGRCEIVRGRVVLATATFREDGRVEGKFCHELRSFAEPRGPGKVLVGEVGIYTGRDPDTIRGADVVFLSSERYARCRRKRGFLDVAPDLVSRCAPNRSRGQPSRRRSASTSRAEYDSYGSPIPARPPCAPTGLSRDFASSARAMSSRGTRSFRASARR